VIHQSSWCGHNNVNAVFERFKLPIDIDTARKKLATILVPLVKEAFMPRFEWDIKELQEIEMKVIDLYGEALRLSIQQK